MGGSAAALGGSRRMQAVAAARSCGGELLHKLAADLCIEEENLRTSDMATGCWRSWRIAPSESLKSSKTASAAMERHGFAWRDASPSYLYGETLLTEPDVHASAAIGSRVSSFLRRADEGREEVETVAVVD